MAERRLLHVVGTIDPKAGGVSEAIRALIEYSPPEYTHEVVTVDAPDAEFLGRLPFVVHALGPYARLLEYSSRLLPWLRANASRFDGVFIHGLWIYPGYAAWRAFRGRKPYAVFPHGMLDPYFKRAFPLKHLKKWLWWLAAEFWVLRGAYRVLFTCAAEERLARESFRLHRWSPYVVAFGATGPQVDATEARESFWERCPAVRNRRFLLFLGRIHRKKGCDLLLEAFRRCAVLDRELDVVMAGPDQQGWRAELMEGLAAAGLGHRVHWTGMLEGREKWGAFFASEAFVLPSHQENFGLAVAESLACGTPALLSDKVNIAPDVAEDGAGLMEDDTLEGTVRLLERWIGMTHDERRAMGAQARATFVKRYDMRSNAPAIVRVFEPLWAGEGEGDGQASAL